MSGSKRKRVRTTGFTMPSPPPREPAEKLIRDAADLLDSLAHCPECIDPHDGLEEDCHAPRYRKIRQRLREFLARSPN